MKGLQVESLLIGCENGASHEGEGWKLVTSGTQGMAPAPPPDLQLFDMQVSSLTRHYPIRMTEKSYVTLFISKEPLL